MLKRVLKFIGFVFLLVTVWVQSHELFLCFFVFFSMLPFAPIYFLEENNRGMFAGGIFLCGVFYVIFFIRYPSVEIFLIGIFNVAIVALLMWYRNTWSKIVAIENAQCERAHQNWRNLEAKHKSRLESLHHLEKQVAGLLDLFEIARDFNDTLSFEGIAAILSERVRPELQFEEMFLALVEKKETERQISRILCINERGVQDNVDRESLSDSEIKALEKVTQSRVLFQEDNRLTFPIIIDGEIGAYLLIAGIQQEDLAKFEVLAAYLALQIKKVRLYETVRELSIHDGLTGVYVRRHFVERFDEELKRSMKYNLPLAVLMLDIDQFKRYNDAYGHLAGDATLKQVAALLRQNLRRVDVVARYGGEEFVVVTPETRKSAVIEVAERIRSNIARHGFKIHNEQTRVTVSIGIALFPDDIPPAFPMEDTGAVAMELISRADRALYQAKEEGRNRIVFYQEF